jgi:hypothetical protein
VGEFGLPISLAVLELIIGEKYYAGIFIVEDYTLLRKHALAGLPWKRVCGKRSGKDDKTNPRTEKWFGLFGLLDFHSVPFLLPLTVAAFV